MNECVSLREEFSDWEIPPIVTLPARGAGFVRLLHGNLCYLLRHTEEGTPILMGMLTTKFLKVRDHYRATYIPSEEISSQTRHELEGLLSQYRR